MVTSESFINLVIPLVCLWSRVVVAARSAHLAVGSRLRPSSHAPIALGTPVTTRRSPMYGFDIIWI
jgi:hypothetical protein